MGGNMIEGPGYLQQSGYYGGVASQQRLQERQSILADNALCPIAQPSMDEISGLQGYYNGCLGSINQLRYGNALPDLQSMMMQNPQMMMFMMMYQQIQMQNMMLMMMLMMRQNGMSPDMISRMLNGGGNNCGNSGNYGNYGNQGSPYASGSSYSGGVCNNPDKQKTSEILENTANKYGIPPDILKGIAWQESRWNNSCVGDGGKSFGMMQIYTSAHPDYKVQEGKNDVAYNIEYAAKFLRNLYDQTGSWEKAVERYNGSGPMARKYASSVMGHVQNKPWLA
ncbi:MAG: lytic transglycosylase domain-containing protein [Candidatus Eremiobacteraeota bacterium]|nr:lytic transglycosylase domain-containing protein [Candidatus Eremiobacteraeota bacterium]